MPIGEISIQNIYEAAGWNDPDVACEILMEEGDFRDRTLFELLVTEDLWVNADSRAKRMQMLVKWLLCEFVCDEVREPTKRQSHRAGGAVQADSEARWSLTLRDETRRALLEPPLDRVSDGKLHLKNVDGRFGYIDLDNLMKGFFRINQKSESSGITYGSSEDVVQHGWAID